MNTNFSAAGASDEHRGWRVGHQGRDRMYYEERHDGVWERIDIDGEMLTGRAHHVIYFASPDRWLQYPAWARDRRDEIIARITSELREPDYEYHGVRAGAPDAGPAPQPSAGAPKAAPAQAAARPVHGARALLVAVLALFALTGVMGWLVTSGVVRGETYLPMKRAYLRRVVSREQEPGLFWLSVSVYAVVGAGALTLGALGVRAGRRLS